jgi:hypothetical protein
MHALSHRCSRRYVAVRCTATQAKGSVQRRASSSGILRTSLTSDPLLNSVHDNDAGGDGSAADKPEDESIRRSETMKTGVDGSNDGSASTGATAAHLDLSTVKGHLRRMHGVLDAVLKSQMLQGGVQMLHKSHVGVQDVLRDVAQVRTHTRARVPFDLLVVFSRCAA